LYGRRDGGRFGASQGALSAVWSVHTSEAQRRMAEKRPRPFGLRPKSRPAALLVVHLDALNFTPRALPGPILGSNATIG
jgi:hypothetical protein